MQGLHERARHPVAIIGIAMTTTGCLIIGSILYLMVGRPISPGIRAPR